MSLQPPPICDYEDSDYQARFWDSGQRVYEDRVEALALRRLLPIGQGRLLEVGAGAGRHSSRYRGYRQVVLIDHARTQLQQAQSRLGPSRRYLYVVCDVYRLPFAPGVFEAATMIRVIHHLARPCLALRQVRATLTPGSVFVLEYANKQNAKAILRWLLGRQDWNPLAREPVEFATLNFNFHPAAVRQWLQETHFKVTRQLTVSHFRIEFLKRWLPLRLLVGLDSLAQLTGDWWQLSPSVFVRAEASGAAPEAGEAFWRCPECEGLNLKPVGAGLECEDCGRLWPSHQGIYDFKEPLEP